MKESFEFSSSEYSVYACGPALNTPEDMPIRTTSALAAGGNYRNHEIESMISSITGNSLTVLPVKNHTVCVITSEHFDAERGYQLNAAFAFSGNLRNLLLDYPEEFFCLYDRICGMNANDFRAYYQKEMFRELITEACENTQNLKYTIRKAGLSVLKSFLASVIQKERKVIYVAEGEREELCRSLRLIPLPLRQEVSFSAPVYNNGYENIANVIVCSGIISENPPSLVKKAGYRQVQVTDEYKFDDYILKQAEYLFQADRRAIDNFARMDKETAQEKLSELSYCAYTNKSGCDTGNNGHSTQSGNVPSVRRNPVEEEYESQEEAFRDDLQEKNGLTFSVRDSFKTVFSEFRSGKIAGIILLLSIILYVLNNLEIHIGDMIYLKIILNSFDKTSIFCIILILVCCVSLVVSRIRSVFRKDE